MKQFFVRFVIPAVLVGSVMSCKPEIKNPTATKGNMDPARFVAIGNSITSGYADGALYYEGQKNSFVNIIAEQFKLIGGGEFRQPLMDAGSVGVGTDGNARFKLDNATDCLGASSLMPVLTATAGDLNALSTNIYAAQGPFNNMGVPGARVITAVKTGYGNPAAGTGNYNPFFYRMASDAVNASMLNDAVAINPTFFSVFLGNNDVMGYALAGAASDAITPSAGGVGIGFDATYDAIINALVANGAKGVIANVPDVTSLPYFTTIPYNGLNLRQGQADSLNNATGNFFNFKAGPNPFIIEDTSVAFVGARPIAANELILLDVPLDQIKCHGMGSLTPIPNKYVLTTTEISAIQNAIAAYNARIQSVADARGLAFVDVNGFLRSTQKGIVYNGVTLSSAFVTGGAFSLDGVHLNPIGQALLANEFIKAINKRYGSTIPEVDVTKYRGVIFP